MGKKKMGTPWSKETDCDRADRGYNDFSKFTSIVVGGEIMNC